MILTTGPNAGTDYRLPANTRKAWVKRLRSGLNQAQSRLCQVEANGEKSYCCLGVLAEQKRLFVPGSEAPGFATTFTERAVALVPEVDDAYMELDGQRTHVGYLSTTTMPMEVQKVLAKKNDEGQSFPKIADWIEENL